VTAPTGQVSSQVLHRMQISGSITCCLFNAVVACVMSAAFNRSDKCRLPLLGAESDAL
jgi:hypothetical protein